MLCMGINFTLIKEASCQIHAVCFIYDLSPENPGNSLLVPLYFKELYYGKHYREYFLMPGYFKFQNLCSTNISGASRLFLTVTTAKFSGLNKVSTKLDRYYSQLIPRGLISKTI